MKNNETKIFTNEKIPFVELRYSSSLKNYKEHFHDTFSLGAMVNGERTYTNKDNTYMLKPEMLSIINPKIMHSCNTFNKNSTSYYMIYLDTSWCEKVQNLINNDIKSFLPIKEELSTNKDLYDKYINLCENLFLDIQVGQKEELLIEFFLDFFSSYIINKQIEISDENLLNIIEYLENNYKEKIFLEDIAKEFNLNSFYIIKLFKTKLKITPIAYLLNLRINKAKKMLKDGISVIDTALECGFYDQSHFHKNFLKIVALTPNEYKVNFVQD